MRAPLVYWINCTQGEKIKLAHENGEMLSINKLNSPFFLLSAWWLFNGEKEAKMLLSFERKEETTVV